MLAARIHIRPSLLVIDEPSRGVDVGARREIHNLLSRVARSGAAVLIATSDVEEAVTICDRLLIFRDGYISAALSGTSKTEAAVLDAAGQRLEQV
jgi:ABC-type sugar transport system ATPase subunit